MAAGDLVISGERVVTERGVGPATVVVRAGVIAEVRQGEVARGSGVIEAGPLAVMPGVVDTHVHVNEPGRTEWEGFETATRAAAAGGVTTIVAMPLNCTPAVTDERTLLGEANAAEGKCIVDYGFWGGVVPGNAGELEGQWRAGALGFKCFLSPSGVDDFGSVSERDLITAMPRLKELGAVLLVHAEDPAVLERARGGVRESRKYLDWLDSRPPEAETAAIELLLKLARRFGARIHIVHLATGTAATLLRKARREGIAVTVETCPHYLWFAADDIGDGQTQFKCAPPIRSRVHRHRLWDLLSAGDIDLIASDHSPCPPGLKRLDTGDFFSAWGGISSLQLSFAVVWSEARRQRRSLAEVCRWMCEGPARLAGLEGRKGRIARGCDGDLVVIDPDAEFTVDAAQLHHRHTLTPYDGARLFGVVHETLVRGRRVYRGGEFGREAIGQWLKRT
jgi:allantoinase